MRKLNLVFVWQGVCLKDKYGQAYCQCAGSFAGPNCEEKSEFAYISGGETPLKNNTEDFIMKVLVDLPSFPAFS
jgi:hypothetical protein